MAAIAYRTNGGFDEMFRDDGQPRPKMAKFVKRLEALADGDLVRHQKAAESMLRNLGITFAVYGHQDGTEKVWPFDILPRVIEPEEWTTIERGLKQRIRALNLFLQDIYGERRVLKEKIVPEELILSAKTYRPSCAGLNPPKGVWCHVTGTDLVRDRDGQFYVLEDNLRCPSGVSYVLENREVMKRTFPQVFQGVSISPVEDYPERLLATLQACAPAGVTDPTVVVLTPGIYNSAYFEHSFLAQKMGVELVQGSDLIVRNGHVLMRTTRGPKRVDVIYRRIDDDFIDPKFFREDSVLGVPGIMEVYRAGRVTLANAPATGIADDKAVYSYVPKLIQFYLSEEPILPNVPTYLCNDEKDRKYVLEHLDQLVVKPVNESGGYGILMGPQATAAQRSAYIDLICTNPRNYIAQPMLTLSTAPTVIDGHLQARHIDLRPFVLCAGEDIYVLPGGLTRVALREGSMIVNSSQGGGSKDTWVVVAGGRGRKRGDCRSKRCREGITAMLSRVADSVFWMARYVERAENVARFIDVNHNLTLDLGEELADQWAPLVYTTGDAEPFFAKYETATRENVLRFLTFDLENPNSILSCLSHARENARTAREIISSDMWEELNRFYLLVSDAVRAGGQSDHDFFARIKRNSHLLIGTTDATMSHGEAWHFARMGRLLERADKSTRILDVKYFILLPQPTDVGTTLDVTQWSALLRSTSALEMYRRCHGRISPNKVIDFLLLDRQFPRSVRYCVGGAEASLHAITGTPGGMFNNKAEQELGRLRSELDFTSIDDIIAAGLHEFIDEVQFRLNNTGEAIFKTFFAADVGGERLRHQEQMQ